MSMEEVKGVDSFKYGKIRAMKMLFTLMLPLLQITNMSANENEDTKEFNANVVSDGLSIVL